MICRVKKTLEGGLTFRRLGSHDEIHHYPKTEIIAAEFVKRDSKMTTLLLAIVTLDTGIRSHDVFMTFYYNFFLSLFLAQ